MDFGRTSPRRSAGRSRHVFDFNQELMNLGTTAWTARTPAQRPDLPDVAEVR